MIVRLRRFAFVLALCCPLMAELHPPAAARAAAELPPTLRGGR